MRLLKHWPLSNPSTESQIVSVFFTLFSYSFLLFRLSGSVGSSKTGRYSAIILINPILLISCTAADSAAAAESAWIWIGNRSLDILIHAIILRELHLHTYVDCANCCSIHRHCCAASSLYSGGGPVGSSFLLLNTQSINPSPCTSIVFPQSTMVSIMRISSRIGLFSSPKRYWTL